MALHRYRTAAIVGEWRPTRAQAHQDALRAGQACRDAAEPDGLRWAVSGEIETDRPFHAGRPRRL